MFLGLSRRTAVLCATLSLLFGGAIGANAQETSNGAQGDLVAQADQGLSDVYELPPVEVTVDSPIQKPTGATASIWGSAENEHGTRAHEPRARACCERRR